MPARKGTAKSAAKKQTPKAPAKAGGKKRK
jgi:hypothetical protein